MILHLTAERGAEVHLLAESQIARERIQQRMATHEQILRGAAEYIAARPGLPTREEWHRYVQSLDLDRLNRASRDWGSRSGSPWSSLARNQDSRGVSTEARA